ncbi:tyrosine-type recombinase/integrase [Novosphingobium sp. ERN07]|nr:tyrosine-type recombinase/integrase [Novosphingobium sp. ERN07]
MRKNPVNSKLAGPKTPSSLGSPGGCLHPENAGNSAHSDELSDPIRSHLHPQTDSGVRRAFLDGNFARQYVASQPKEYEIWDTVLIGFGMRIQPNGRSCWFVRKRHRGSNRRVTLGRCCDVDALAARREARRILLDVALDGLPRQEKVSASPVFIDFADEFWRDYARHWKPSTQHRNRSAINGQILPYFAEFRLSEISRTDIVRWRDACAHVAEARFNRAVPVLASMLKYAEQLGLRPKGKNPCRGIPRFKRKLLERYLSPVEYVRLVRRLDEVAEQSPLEVAAVRLLIFTGARLNEICALQWDWVQPPRLVLPDSKTGAKVIVLNRQASEVLAQIPLRSGTSYVFPRSRGEGFLDLNNWWRKFRRTCALPDVRLHDLRHSFASVAVREGLPLATIGGLLGHALPETTARYAHLADQTIADAAARVASHLAAALGIEP